MNLTENVHHRTLTHAPFTLMVQPNVITIFVGGSSFLRCLNNLVINYIAPMILKCFDALYICKKSRFILGDLNFHFYTSWILFVIKYFFLPFNFYLCKILKVLTIVDFIVWYTTNRKSRKIELDVGCNYIYEV